LEKERQHYLNALHALRANGDETATEGLEAELAEIERAIEQVDYRAASAGGSCGANLRRSPGRLAKSARRFGQRWSGLVRSGG
jgi:hypothetical protein